MCQSFIPFYGRIIFRCINRLNCIYSSTDEHLGCFHLLASMNNAMNIHIQVSVWTYVFSLEYIHRSRIGRLYGNYVFKFLRYHQTPPKFLHHFTLSAAVYESSNFSTSSSTNNYYHLFDCRPSSSCEKESHNGLDLHFPSD